MDSFSLNYCNLEQLNKFIKEKIPGHFPEHYSALLIQVFCGANDEDRLNALLSELKERLPQACVIGASTSGEIIDGTMHANSICLNFTIFHHTQITAHYISDVDYDAGVDYATQYISNNTKALICFGESLNCDPLPFFSGIYAVRPDVIIAGGNAGDNNQFVKTFIIADGEIKSQGVVICTLDSERLQVNTNHALNWLPIGREMIITKSDLNVVFEINDQPVLEVYKYYFGDNIALNMPLSLIEFPLVKVENNIDIARSVVGVNPDNSFVYAGHLVEGDRVRFAVGNVDEAELDSKRLQQRVNQQPCETNFVYSCSVRQLFLGDNLNFELGCLEVLAPTCGFFTYGEFFSTGISNQVLSITITVLSLCENLEKKPVQHLPDLEESLVQTRMKSLTCLVNVTQRELQESIALLQMAQQQLIETEKMASLGALVAGISHEINTPVGVAVSGNSQIEYEINKLEQLYNDQKLSEEALLKHISNGKELTTAVASSLQQAVDLVNSFKNISVDQHSENGRKFNLKHYCDEIFTTFKPELRKVNASFDNKIADNITLIGSPGVFAQIFSNLIMNAIVHGFSDNNQTHKQSNKENKIVIYTEQTENLIIHFCDNGKGVDADIVKKIFDPFFTTTRGTGGSGLGLNIVYNLVTQKLKGMVGVDTTDKTGFHLVITLINDEWCA